MSKKPKLIVETKIKSCNTKAKNDSVSFDCFTLSDDQRNQVIQWVKDEERGRLSFEPVQENG